jgi:hypothetical protein
MPGDTCDPENPCGLNLPILVCDPPPVFDCGAGGVSSGVDSGGDAAGTSDAPAGG